MSPVPVLDLAGQPRGPLHVRLARALRTEIRAGRLPVGAALPPSRELARALGSSRWTVTEAYTLLSAEGYVEARTGAGTHVRWTGHHHEQIARRSPRPTPPPGIDLRPGLPDLRAFPRRRWVEKLRAQAALVEHADFDAPDRTGHPILRASLREYLERGRGASPSSSTDLLISTSTSAAVERICRALRSSGIEHVAVEDPGWTRLHHVLRSAGIQVVPMPVDQDGLIVAALHEQPHVRAVLVTPAHQFPTGVALAPHRRSELLDWADSVDGLVLEDDYDAEFRYDHAPIASLQGMRPRRVALLGSLSKTMSPALGIGWMLLPHRWAESVTALDTTVPVPSVLDQLTFGAFLTSGGYDRHLRATRRRYLRRRDALVTAISHALPESQISGLPAGLHLILHLPQDADANDVLAHAAAHGLRLTDAERYDTLPRPRTPRLVIGYGNLADPAVETAALVLAKAVNASATTDPAKPT